MSDRGIYRDKGARMTILRAFSRSGYKNHNSRVIGTRLPGRQRGGRPAPAASVLSVAGRLQALQGPGTVRQVVYHCRERDRSSGGKYGRGFRAGGDLCSLIPACSPCQPTRTYTISGRGKISVAPRRAVDFPDGRPYTTPQDQAGREVGTI